MKKVITSLVLGLVASMSFATTPVAPTATTPAVKNEITKTAEVTKATEATKPTVASVKKVHKAKSVKKSKEVKTDKVATPVAPVTK